MKSNETGRFGENEACRYLESRGYGILMRNYRSRYGEIDIVAAKDGAVDFVEVKARRDRAFAEAAQAVGPSKQEKLRKTALCWFAEYGEQPARFDVLEIYTGTARRTAFGEAYRTEIRHIKNAF